VCKVVLGVELSEYTPISFLLKCLNVIYVGSLQKGSYFRMLLSRNH